MQGNRFPLRAVGLVLMIVPGLWLLADLFLIPGMVRDYNDTIIQKLSGCTAFWFCDADVESCGRG
jgi:hypothetical protein